MNDQYWAALVVAANYSLVITLYPAILMIHHRWIKKYEDPLLAYTCCLCCTLCGKKDAPKEDPKPDAHEKVPSDAPPAALTRQLSMKDGVGDGSEYRGMEQFLGRKWSAWIAKTKFINLVVFFIMFVVGLSLAASQLEPDDDIFRTWKTASWFYSLETVQGDFGESEDDGLLSLYITYGIEGVDRSDLKTFEKDNLGDIVWDDDFEMYTTSQQNYLYQTCQELRNSSMVYEPPNSEYVRCPIMEWINYLNSTSEIFPYDAGSKEAFAEKWSEFLDSDFAEDTNGYKLSWVEQDDGDSMIRFYAMYVDLPILFSATSTEGEQYRDDFDDYIDENKENCPDHLCDYMHNTSWRWWLLAVESNFLMSALSGIAIALPLAFVVLLISTRNWIISIFAIMDIIGVISCELCVIYMAGWRWGLTESIAVIMVIGFSVDYVVHLANSYLESQGETRMERLSFALLTMGVSVVSGAITTMLSGIMLVFPSYLFFYKMGWIIVTTVLLALMWALIFFPSMCAWIGPEGDQGDLTKYFAFCPCNKGEKEEAQQSADEGPKEEEGNAIELGTKA